MVDCPALQKFRFEIFVHHQDLTQGWSTMSELNELGWNIRYP